MTREEARYLLNNLRSVAEGKEDEAIDMAIEALQTLEAVERIKTEVLPQTDLVRCKDCIHGERDAVFVYCTRYYRRIGTEDYCSSGERSEP